MSFLASCSGSWLYPRPLPFPVLTPAGAGPETGARRQEREALILQVTARLPADLSPPHPILLYLVHSVGTPDPGHPEWGWGPTGGLSVAPPTSFQKQVGQGTPWPALSSALAAATLVNQG